MANPKSLKPFKPGQSGNPKGRPKDPPELKQLQQLTKGELSVLINKILQSKPEDINKFDGTILEKWLASIIFQGIKTGDFGRLNPILDRIIGKVKDEVSGELGIKIVIEDYCAKKED